MAIRPHGEDEVDHEAEDREAILKRRARFVATALSALTIGVGAACDGEVRREDQTSTSASGGGEGGMPQPCLSPQPCLDVGPEPTSSSAGGEGGAPQPCLGMPADGGGGVGGVSSASAGGDGDGGAGGDPGAGGEAGAAPCLAPPPRPRR